MLQLSATQSDLIASLSAQLANIPGIHAVVLGGSHARGRALPGSDIDVGVLYSEAAPFAIADLRAFAASHNDTPSPTVTGFYEWGRWVNGGSWLTVRGQRVDVLYRSIEHLERVIDDCHAGRYEIDYAQQPPFGFCSATYLGELAICLPLSDPTGLVPRLKQRVVEYPAALQRSLVQDSLWAVELGLSAFATKFAARGDAYGTAGCLTRAVNQLVLALFALNRTHLLNDKTALAEITQFERAPTDFSARVQRVLAHPGNTIAELSAAVVRIRELLDETSVLAAGLYQANYRLP